MNFGMNRWIVTSTLAIGAFGCAAGALGEGAAGKDEEKEVKVRIEDCPAAVRQTITREAAGGTVKGVESETEDGKTEYHADITIDGKDYEIEVGDDGALVSKKLDDDKEDGDNDEKEGKDDDDKDGK